MTVNCGVCDRLRENHPQLNHEFTLGNQLIPKKNTRHPQWADQSTLMRLALVLHEKGVFFSDDLQYVFPDSGFDFGTPSNSRDL